MTNNTKRLASLARVVRAIEREKDTLGENGAAYLAGLIDEIRRGYQYRLMNIEKGQTKADVVRECARKGQVGQ